MGDIVRPSKGQHIVGDSAIALRDCNGLSPERLSQSERISNPVALLLCELQAAARFHIDRRQRTVQTISETLGVAHETRTPGIFTYANENAFTGCPRPLNRAGLHLGEELFIHSVGGTA